MTQDEPFRELMLRVRAGDEAAAAELIRTYEPVVHRYVRVHLGRGRLRRLFDSADFTQSVLGSFFIGLTLDKYAVDSPRSLVNLLLTMARNKVAMGARRVQPGGLPAAGAALPDAHLGPSTRAALGDLLQQVRRRLSDDERCLADLRGQGLSWPQIAAALGESPDALRMRLARAAGRVARELDLEEYLHA